MHLQVKVPGSCGELIQGTKDGVPFLVTCPIDCYTTVTVSPGKGRLLGLGEKAKMALVKVLELLSVPFYPYDLCLESELLPGKGMASSSADIAAVCFAAAASLGQTLSAAQVGAIASAIEPTDGVFFAGIVRMNQLNGECLESLGFLPPLRIAIFDTGGVVDTLQFHKRPDLPALNRRNEAAVEKAVTLLQKKDSRSVGQAALLSALANQSVLPKKHLADIAAHAMEAGAVGLNVAHSGTVLGILFLPETPAASMDAMAVRLRAAFPELQYLRAATLVPGGYTITRKGR